MDKNELNSRNEKLSKEIQELYNSGKTYNEIHELLGASTVRIAKVVKGTRSHSEAYHLARKKGRGILSDAGRLRLSEAGIRAVTRGRKFWTKPEQEFKNILNGLGLGVQFPEYVTEVCDVVSDSNPSICFQYPIVRYVCDFVCVEKKIVFRVNGDYWHANPILYNENNLTKPQKINLRQDSNCKNYLEKLGWIVCDIWESEIYWNKALVESKIRACMSLVDGDVYTIEAGPGSIPPTPTDWSGELRRLWFKDPRPQVEKKIIKCNLCGKEISISSAVKRKRKHCSIQCSSMAQRKVERPSCEQLSEEIKNMSWVALGKKYGVSDRSVKKWAIQYGLLSTE